ncbi:MAG: prolipoprotein diacylglyceryl transferase [Deltaproteobacteria bacterium]|nr:prolipoprotein diacylglyceryl transferase [Deltaproteobacteria bacterium]NND27335.1 prolipoprotein diacylglyceryl transferase [Myxococcales bacterium]MBT8464289.1 prolipoprotein diacylglyceryl transferase [Deltaproteobacteria bacterium]MBT8483066.1 prolipoprotein diacylglyceryl transferase [Deltaproteobacteria bacterium]NNK06842.1 prolipoprotein diacylglyceryl transferase [Myxococcales bacterium]
MHPVLFSIPTPWGAIPIYSYGVMLGSSLLFAWYYIMYMGKRVEGYNRELLASCFTWTAVGAIVGARLLYIFTNLDSYDSFGSWFDLRSGGLVAYGGFLGGFATALAFWRLKKIPLLPFADIAAPTLASGLMLTRVGCYLYGCDYGRPLRESAPGWLGSAGTFPKWDSDAYPAFACDQTINGSPAYQHHLQEYPDLMVDRLSSLAVHPTQIYESIAGLFLFIFATWLLTHRTFRGQVLVTVAGIYGLWRFLIEYLRDDPERGFAFGFSTSQLISLALIPLCIIAYVHFKKRSEEHGDIALPPWALEQAAGSEEEAKSGDERPARYRPKKIKKKK